MHDFYNRVEYTLNPAEENTTYPNQYKDQIGRQFGLSCNTADVNAYYVLTQQVRVVTRTDPRKFSADTVI